MVFQTKNTKMCPHGCKSLKLLQPFADFWKRETILNCEWILNQVELWDFQVEVSHSKIQMFYRSFSLWTRTSFLRKAWLHKTWTEVYQTECSLWLIAVLRHLQCAVLKGNDCLKGVKSIWEAVVGSQNYIRATVKCTLFKLMGYKIAKLPVEFI